MKNVIFMFCVIVFFLASCGDIEQDDCTQFCDLLDELGCEEALGSPGPDSDYETTFDNIPCEEICELFTDKNTLSCYGNIKSCDEIKECE